MFTPDWIEAAADAAAVVEKGIDMAVMRGRKHAEVAATAAPPAPTVMVKGITGQDFLFGMLLLAAAVIAAALIIHHGLSVIAAA